MHTGEDSIKLDGFVSRNSASVQNVSSAICKYIVSEFISECAAFMYEWMLKGGWGNWSGDAVLHEYITTNSDYCRHIIIINKCWPIGHQLNQIQTCNPCWLFWKVLAVAIYWINLTYLQITVCGILSIGTYDSLAYSSKDEEF